LLMVPPQGGVQPHPDAVAVRAAEAETAPSLTLRVPV
jgi:hypothetical protein